MNTILGEFAIDEEYNSYLELWNEYRAKTEHLTEREAAKAREEYKIIFSHFSKEVERNPKFIRAKRNSLDNFYKSPRTDSAE